MADQLATPQDLAALVQSDLDLSTATVVIEAVTAVVQEAAGRQRLIQVADDVEVIQGTTDAWLALPQRPVTAVSSVVLDTGDTVTLGTGSADYKLIGNRLWSRAGWQTDFGFWFSQPYLGRILPGWSDGVWDSQTPGLVTITYTHGLLSTDWRYQLARSATLGIAKGIVVNANGLTSERIDDYSVAYEAAATRMEASPALRSALQRQYGRRAGLVRIG